MKIGLIGLGRMGHAIAKRLLNAHVEVIGYDRDEHARKALQAVGGTAVDSVQTVAAAVDKIWLMVPAGAIVDAVIDELIPVLPKESVIIDGGNSYFRDSIKRAERLQQHAIGFLDCGTSGGLHGESLGFSLMIGGDEQTYAHIKPFFNIIAAPQGYALVGPVGAGHYVKMVHNGIEYALLQAYAEGFHLLKDGYYKNLDLAQITEVWSHGSIVRSWIVELAHTIFTRDQEFNNVSGEIGGGQTGRWALKEAMQAGIAVPLLEKALDVRSQSYTTGGDYATKLVALLRHEFGGHEVTLKEKK